MNIQRIRKAYLSYVLDALTFIVILLMGLLVIWSVSARENRNGPRYDDDGHIVRQVGR